MQLILAIAEGPDLDPVRVSRLVHWIRPGQTLTVGRDRRHAELAVVSDANMSAAHFQVSCRRDGCSVKDLDSRHGTFVNGARITESPLADGDQIEAGRTRFNIQITGGNVAPLPHPFGAAAEPPPGVTDTLPVDESAAGEPQTLLPEPEPVYEPARAWGRGGSLQVVLQIHQGPWGEGKYSSLEQLLTWIRPKERVAVGRSHDRADMAIQRDRQLSAMHFELSNDGSRCFLRDLGSTNGTFLNGQRVASALLRNGDEIQAGRTHFIVALEGGEAVSDEQIMASLVSAEPEPEPVDALPPDHRYRIWNTSPLTVAPFVGRIEYPEHSLSVVVKGTFRLEPDGVARLADEQRYATGAVPYDGDDEPQGPPRYESDFAFFKPKADMLLVGTCHAPGGRPAARVPVEFRVGKRSRKLDVFGARTWKVNGKTVEPGEPEPFTELEMRYEHSFGGPDCEANPVGTGYRDRSAPLEATRLPRIEDPAALVKSPDDRVPPAGFGPESPWAERRRKQLGTFDADWERNRWPWFPADFNWSHANAAPPEMQGDGYLRGDEAIYLKNLHARYAELHSRLPGIRPRCFVSAVDGAFREVAMVLDTLWIDADNDDVVLVWRGHAAVASDQCEDVGHLFVMCESLRDPARPVSECHSLFHEHLAARDAPSPEPAGAAAPAANEAAAEPAEPPSADATAAEPASDAADPAEEKFRAELLALTNQIREAQIAAGVDPDAFDREVRAQRERLVRQWGLDGDVDPVALEAKVNAELDRIKGEVRDAQRAAGLDPGPDPQPASHSGPEEAATPEAARPWSRERVREHHAAGGSFAGQDLSELDLSGLDFSGTDFERAILARCKLRGTRLGGAAMTMANLAGADLTGADLQSATLDDVDLAGANLAEARLDKAHAHRAVFAGATLTRASLHRADATRAQFTKADCSGANLSSAVFAHASFQDAVLDEANLQLSSLVEAEMAGVSAPRAVFKHADLTRLRAAGGSFPDCDFQQIQAEGSIWERAGLVRADFSHARLAGANFTRARLAEARLTAADLTGGRLSDAQLRRARMSDMNLFEADLRRADLTDADLRRSNLYGAETFESVWDGAKREAANLKMTKMAHTESE